MNTVSKTITLKPRMSEKAYSLTTNDNVYVFVVPKTANKHTVAEAVSTQFDVTVTNVRVAIQKGKAVTSRRKRARSAVGRRADIKKAYVTLKEGDHIAIFDAEEDTKTSKKSDKKTDSKVDSKADKTAKKEKK
jgi:large subunit ribosomal protein L23